MFCHFASVIVLHANRQASRNCHMYHQAALQPLLETCWSPMQMLFIVYIQCSLEYISYLASLLVQSPSGACHKTFCEDVLCWWSNGWMDEFLLEGKKKSLNDCFVLFFTSCMLYILGFCTDTTILNSKHFVTGCWRLPCLTVGHTCCLNMSTSRFSISFSA